jgi:hypothetical protein
MLVILNNGIEEQVKAVIEQEKGNRQDLNLLANSYAVQLKKRNDLWSVPGTFERISRRLWANNEFADIKKASGKTSTSPTKTTKRPIIGPGFLKLNIA